MSQIFRDLLKLGEEDPPSFFPVPVTPPCTNLGLRASVKEYFGLDDGLEDTGLIIEILEWLGLEGP